MIAAGSFVRWDPQDPSKIFCEDTAVMISERLPLIGILSRIDGDIGRMSYMQINGKRGEITVMLSELVPLGGVPHAE
jgi:hypothetical protein